MIKRRKNDIVYAAIAIILVCLLMAAMSGCTEEQQSPPVWGQGNPPPEYQGFFGNDNGARLNFMQNQSLDKHAKIIREIAKRVLMLEYVDPNEVPLEARVDVLESQMVELREPTVFILEPGPCGNMAEEACGTPILKCLTHPNEVAKD